MSKLLNEKQAGAEVAIYLLQGLMIDGADHKQWYLEQALRVICNDVDQTKVDLGWKEGLKETPCPFCDGSGETVCDEGHQHRCPGCHGSGVKLENTPGCKSAAKPPSPSTPPPQAPDSPAPRSPDSGSGRRP